LGGSIFVFALLLNALQFSNVTMGLLVRMALNLENNRTPTFYTLIVALNDISTLREEQIKPKHTRAV
jgi:hypothetical protein